MKKIIFFFAFLCLVICSQTRAQDVLHSPNTTGQELDIRQYYIAQIIDRTSGNNQPASIILYILTIILTLFCIVYPYEAQQKPGSFPKPGGIIWIVEIIAFALLCIMVQGVPLNILLLIAILAPISGGLGKIQNN